MTRRLSIAVALVLAVVAGIAGASTVTPGTAAPPPPGGRDELPAGDVRAGTPVADPQRGPPWAVRVYDPLTSSRCIAVGRVSGAAFGPVDAAGEIRDTGAVASGACADPAEQPNQVAVARYAGGAGAGPRSVAFGIVDATVTSVEVLAPGVEGPVAVGAERTFIVVGDGLWPQGDTTVTLTSKDGITSSYRR